jgi:hypothetical protein
LQFSLQLASPENLDTPSYIYLGPTQNLPKLEEEEEEEEGEK